MRSCRGRGRNRKRQRRQKFLRDPKNQECSKARHGLRTDTIEKLAPERQWKGKNDVPTERVMIVPSFKSAIIRTMKGGKSNLKANAMTAKPTTIRIVTVQVGVKLGPPRLSQAEN